MRRSIHMYTFNLALSDILILFFFVPTQMVYVREQLHWTMGLEMCRIVNFVIPVALASTAFTLLAISFDRCRGLTQPFKYRSDSKKTAKVVLPLIWLLALSLSTPLFY